MAVGDLISQIMASEAAGDLGAGGGGLANLFSTKLVTAATPAPEEPGVKLTAPPLTAQTLTGTDVGAYQRAQEVRDFNKQPPTPAEMAAANARVDDLAAGLRAGSEAESTEGAPVASPIAAALSTAESVPEAPAKPKFTSRLRPQLEAAQAELVQLNAQKDALLAQGQPVDAKTTYEIQIKSGVASKLKAMVDAEEAAFVDAESAAVLERQTNRLTREEELIDQARKRAPGNALMAFGAALAGAKPGEKFASVLARGLQAGSESYTGARDAREESRRTIEEKRDELILKNRELIEKARADAINRANAGATLTEGEMTLANLNQEGVNKLAMAPLELSAAKSKAKTLEVEANYAEELKRLEVQTQKAAIRASDALAAYRKNPPSANSTGIPKGVATYYAALGAQAKSLRAAADNILITDPKVKAGYRAQLATVEAQMRSIEKQLNFSPSAAAPAGGAKVRTYDPTTNTLK
jgi:hypothetical protein